MNYNYQNYREINPNYMNQTNINPINIEQNDFFAEDLLAKNKGKYVKIYMSFSDSLEWCDRIFEGILESFGKDFILLHDKKNNKHYMVWNLYIDFIEFNEDVNI